MIMLLFINRVPIERQPEIAEESQLLLTPDYERSDEPEANTDQAHLGRNFIREQVITLGMTLRSCCLFPLLICVSQEVGNDFRELLPSWLSREYRWSLGETSYIDLRQRLLTALVVSLLLRLFKSIFSGEMGGGVGAKTKNLNSDSGLVRLLMLVPALHWLEVTFRHSGTLGSMCALFKNIVHVLFECWEWPSWEGGVGGVGG